MHGTFRNSKNGFLDFGKKFINVKSPFFCENYLEIKNDFFITLESIYFDQR